MSKESDDSTHKIEFRIPTIKAESEAQTLGHLVSLDPNKMESTQQSQGMSIRKRRNLSKNRGQAARQREKTPEPGRSLVPHEDTTTSDDEDVLPKYRSSREIEADNTYEEMKRLVQEQAHVKDPVYDLDTEEILEARALAANDRRRRSISPFALPDKEDMCRLERKGSFTDPNNKLLSTTYSLSPKDEDKGRRPSLTIEPPTTVRKNSLTSLTTPSTASPREKLDFQYPPKKLEPIVYPDEKPVIETTPKSKPTTPITKETFEFEDKDEKPKSRKSITPKTDASAPTQGEIVTKVIQVERTPSKKLLPENKPNVEVRQRVVRTPSRKSVAETKPIIVRQPKQTPEETQPKLPPVKPARSRSASRFGGKTSESEMSEDQGRMQSAVVAAPRRKVIPTPRRFLRNKSPRANRSQSVNRVEDLKVDDKANTEISKTAKEIIDLIQQRSLSVPKEDPKLPSFYKKYSKTLITPNKTPNKTPPSLSRSSRGISCPKTIQIISGKEILGDLVKPKNKVEKPSRKTSKHHGSGYLDASQSEYTSSCYSTSPSDTEYSTFDLAEKTDELTRKLRLLSHDEKNDDLTESEQKSVLRKRNQTTASSTKSKYKEVVKDKKIEVINVDKKNKSRSRFRVLANWRQFKEENQAAYKTLILQRNRCICDILILIFVCGLGGIMFKTLEGDFENAFKCSTRNVKRDFIESLWRGSHYLREEDWKSMARKKLYEFEDQLHTAHEAGVTSYSGQRSWNFMNSFVYCMTLITTIGYGHIAPKTTYGRIATILYAIVGIPLFLIVLADFGKLFTRIIKFFWSFVRRFYYTKSCRKVRRTVPVQEVMKGFNLVYDVVRRPSQIFNEEDMTSVNPEGKDVPPALQRRPSDAPPPLPPKPGTLPRDLDPEELDPETPAPSFYEVDDEFNLPISVAIVILIIYIIIGATVYHLWETWNFFESFYFVFISMSTIGLGDLVPDHPMFMMASILYLVFGLALTSMCINVVQVKLSNTFMQASAKIGATIGLKVAEEDGSLVPITPPPMEIAPVHQKKSEKEENKKS